MAEEHKIAKATLGLAAVVAFGGVVEWVVDQQQSKTAERLQQQRFAFDVCIESLKLIAENARTEPDGIFFVSAAASDLAGLYDQQCQTLIQHSITNAQAQSQVVTQDQPSPPTDAGVPTRPVNSVAATDHSTLRTAAGFPTLPRGSPWRRWIARADCDTRSPLFSPEPTPTDTTPSALLEPSIAMNSFRIYLANESGARILADAIRLDCSMYDRLDVYASWNETTILLSIEYTPRAAGVLSVRRGLFRAGSFDVIGSYEGPVTSVPDNLKPGNVRALRDDGGTR